MAEYTKNYNLKKPSQDDFYDVGDFNQNFDKIDEVLGLGVKSVVVAEKGNIEIGGLLIQWGRAEVVKDSAVVTVFFDRVFAEPYNLQFAVTGGDGIKLSAFASNSAAFNAAEFVLSGESDAEIYYLAIGKA